MRFHSFRIPLRPRSWNELVRKNYWTVKKIFDEWKEATWAAVKQNKIPKIKNYPIWIYVYPYWKNKHLHDLDNVLVKPVLDTLVKMEILKGDDTRYIKAIILVSDSVLEGEEDGLHITIAEDLEGRSPNPV